MKIIARNNGPKYISSDIGCLTTGKEYDIIGGVKHFQLNNQWATEKITYNPKSTSFLWRLWMITVKYTLSGMIIFYQVKRREQLN